ncbi:DUF302 domain-containing protein [Roseivivax isoporae]|uniref:DUF302 domain-containing protein n=1 Tax=Roseivivax isoporae LMG 25204 TaxID=1449351 RepID=X7F2U4_9RHOB|nr:DUF302 domain-containing protein [Roseivivax isoporae]ETX27105.1 hypothetical protein RISW2_16690 [Roseivivax isoporae LMG 25204]
MPISRHVRAAVLVVACAMAGGASGEDLATRGIVLRPPPPAPAGVVSYQTPLPFDDVIFGLENALVGHGLDVSRQSLVSVSGGGRTDLALADSVYQHAETYSFCSSILAQKMMENDPLNIAFCPYTIFVIVARGNPEVTTIGYRAMPEGPMKEAQALLDVIARNAIGRGG